MRTYETSNPIKITVKVSYGCPLCL